MTRIGILLGAFATALLFARPGRADAQASDALYLRSGSLFRGRVTELVPKDHVTIVVETGEARRFDWADVDHVVVGPPAPALAAPAPAAPAPAAPAPKAPELAHVHVETPRPVVLYRRPPGSTAWEEVCSSPCDEELPVGGTYRVTGNGVPARDFGLQANGGEYVVVGVEPASIAGVVGGAILTAAGFVGVLVGANMDADQRLGECGAGATTPGCTADASAGTQGDVVATVGSLALVGGALLLYFSARTDVRTTAHRPSSVAPALPPDASLRRPIWRSASSVERAVAAPAATFPVLFDRAF
jgi:hypothetical protein